MNRREHGEEKPSFILLLLKLAILPLLVALWLFRRTFDDKPGEWK